jgi:site-specific DNA-methyltransferase (cytosine-N4-specific)
MHAYDAVTAEVSPTGAVATRSAPTAHSDLVTSSPPIERLRAIEWDFAAAKTGYLTHSLHPYPAKFIPQIPETLIRELSSVGDVVADIFCGSGTTLVEALRLKRHAIGIDANPLAGLISRVKTTKLSPEELLQAEEHRFLCERLATQIQSREGDLFASGAAFISEGWRPRPEVCEFWFLPHVVEELAELRRLIGEIPNDAPRNLCLIALSAIVVAVSKQDSDTRYVRREKRILPGDTVRRYTTQLRLAIAAVRELPDQIENRCACRILNEDILCTPDTGPFELVVTSPPYPNAYSYHLYHRTRLMWLGHDPESFKRIEIGSHRKYSANGADRATQQTFRSEFERIFRWLRPRLRNGRHACFVIGDSTLSGARVDNASIIAEAGVLAGFREVARITRRIAANRKTFNPKIGKIKTENILVLQKV